MRNDQTMKDAEYLFTTVMTAKQKSSTGNGNRRKRATGVEVETDINLGGDADPGDVDNAANGGDSSVTSNDEATCTYDTL